MPATPPIGHGMMPAMRHPVPAPAPAATLPLWPLALAAALLPALATLTAWALSLQQGLVPACNPFWDGCVSISRAARHGLPNHLFRAIMLPAATLQGLVWLLAARWLLSTSAPGERPAPGLRLLAPLGLSAALALVLYATFLGTEGPVYRWLRQYGTVVYFGFTCLCLLLAGNAVLRQAAAGRLRLPRPLQGALQALAVVLVSLGVGKAIVAATLGDAMKGRVENVTEWWGALVFVFGFLALAAMWWRLRLRVTLAAERPSARRP